MFQSAAKQRRIWEKLISSNVPLNALWAHLWKKVPALWLLVSFPLRLKFHLSIDCYILYHIITPDRLLAVLVQIWPVWFRELLLDRFLNFWTLHRCGKRFDLYLMSEIEVFEWSSMNRGINVILLLIALFDSISWQKLVSGVKGSLLEGYIFLRAALPIAWGYEKRSKRPGLYLFSLFAVVYSLCCFLVVSVGHRWLIKTPGTSLYLGVCVSSGFKGRQIELSTLRQGPFLGSLPVCVSGTLAKIALL